MYFSIDNKKRFHAWENYSYNHLYLTSLTILPLFSSTEDDREELMVWTERNRTGKEPYAKILNHKPDSVSG